MSETPTEVDLAVDPDEVARRMGMDLPLDGPNTYRLREAILDAMADVQAYLNQPTMPMLYVESGLVPWPEGWALAESPVVRIISATPETYPVEDGGGLTGTFVVTYLAGLDTAHDPALRPIRKEITTRVMENPDIALMWQSVKGDAARRIKSLSVEGQSAGFDYLTPSGEVESISNTSVEKPEDRLKRLDKWRRRSVYQRRGPSYPSGLRPFQEGFYQ